MSPPKVPYRFIGPPAFLAGVAAAYVASIGGRTTPHISGSMGWDNLPVVAWVAVGFIASLGAARVGSGLARHSGGDPPSILRCGTSGALGGFVVFLLPNGWLRLLGGAGLLLMLYLALGLLAGLVDVAMRVGPRSSAK